MHNIRNAVLMLLCSIAIIAAGRFTFQDAQPGEDGDGRTVMSAAAQHNKDAYGQVTDWLSELD
ncbi:MAG: hypothetical protein R3F46_03065 [bacterium]|nr:hypothetical protein [bacterium]